MVRGDGAASGEPEYRDSEAYMWPEVGRQLAACGWVIYRMELDCPGGWWKVRASEVSLAWGLCESLCLCLTHPLSLKAALVCWCLQSSHMRGQARAGDGRATQWFPRLLDLFKGPFLCLSAPPHPPRPALLS